MNNYLIVNRKTVTLMCHENGRYLDPQTHCFGGGDSDYQDVYNPKNTKHHLFSRLIQDVKNPVVDLVFDGDVEHVEAVEWVGKKSLMPGAKDLQQFTEHLQTDFSQSEISIVRTNRAVSFVVITELKLSANLNRWLQFSQKNLVRFRSVQSYSQLIAQHTTNIYGAGMHFVVEIESSFNQLTVRQHCVLAGKSLYSGLRHIEIETDLSAVQECLTHLVDEGILIEAVPMVVLTNSPESIQLKKLEKFREVSSVVCVDIATDGLDSMGATCSRSLQLVEFIRQEASYSKTPASIISRVLQRDNWLGLRTRCMQGLYESIQSSYKLKQAETRYKIINASTVGIAIMVSIFAGIHAYLQWQNSNSEQRAFESLSRSTEVHRTQSFKLFPEPESLAKSVEFIEMMNSMAPFNAAELLSLVRDTYEEVPELQLTGIQWVAIDDEVAVHNATEPDRLAAKFRDYKENLPQQSRLEVALSGIVRPGYSPRENQHFLAELLSALQLRPQVLKVSQSRAPIDGFTTGALEIVTNSDELGGRYRIVFLYEPDQAQYN